MSDKLKAIINALNKKYPGIIAQGAGNLLQPERVSSGILALDLCTGGGIPRGTVIEFFGKESSCKSVAAFKAIASFQSLKYPCALVDVEKSFDPAWAKTLGVNVDELVIAQPDSMEKAIDVVDTLLRSKQFGLVVYDSIAAGLPEEEGSKSANDAQIGLQARLNAKMTRKILAALSPDDISDETTYNKTALIIINQIREKVGVLYGNPQTTPGGHAIRHLYHIRVEFKQGDYITKASSIIGRVIKFKVVKNKTWRPFESGEFTFYFDGTIDNMNTLIVEAIKLGIVIRRGSMYDYKDLTVKGKEALIAELQDKNLISTLEQEVKAQLLGGSK